LELVLLQQVPVVLVGVISRRLEVS